ncbi:transcription factor GTE8-like, partial [Trifolium medium]|nr:transcription factor GTE8-like [Trifolium medium]
MDLGTIKGKLATRSYTSPLEFASDVRLTFSNALTYNPPNNDAHLMAVTLSKFFETRWKSIEKKLPREDSPPLPMKTNTREDVKNARPMPPSKKRKIASPPLQPEIIPSPQPEVIPPPAQPEVILPSQPEVIAPAQPEVITPAKRVMSTKEKQNIASELDSFEGDIPANILDFLKQHCSNGKECEEDELEIDIDDLSDDTLFKLRKLLDDSLMEKQKNEAKVEACEIE